MPTTKYIGAGTQWAFWGQLDATGYFAGTSGTVTTGDNGQAMGQLIGIQRASPGPVEPEDVSIDGDDTSLGRIDFPPNETPAFIAEFGAFNLDTDATLQGTSTETVGGIKLGVLQPENPVYPDVFLILQGKSKSKDAGVGGAKMWSGYIIPRASMTPLGREAFEGRTAATNRYKVTTQVATKKPWGVTIVTGDLGTTGAPLIPFTADNPIVMETFRGDGATQAFTLAYTPVSQARTVVWVDSAPQTAGTDFTVNTTTRVVTFTGTPVDGSKIEVLMEFAP